jgi:tetratricopeptide (TPR) repeat protein
VLALALFALVAAGGPAPPGPAELDALIQKIHSSDAKVRLEASQALAAFPADAMDLLAKRLATPPRGSIDTFRKIVLEMWGQVPNWKSGDPMWISRPEPPWKPPPRVKGQPRAQRPPPHDPETLDWLVALNTVDLAAAAALDADKLIPVDKPLVKAPPAPTPSPSPSPSLPVDWEDARAEAMEKVALIRAIAASKRLDAVDPIFQLAFVLDGVFRDECGRQIRSMDSFAVPRLVRLMHQTGPVAMRLGKQRRYAAYQLDRMDRQRPSKAISTAPDDVVRAEIIHAYGEDEALDAVEAILAQVDAASHRVRKEARWAWRRYTDGKPPPPAPKRKRKLGGGREEDEEKPDYLTYREIAALALQKQVAELHDAEVEASCEARAMNRSSTDRSPLPKPPACKTAKLLTDELFAYYDAHHAAEWDAEWEAAAEKEARGDWQAATDGYGWILAHDPNYQKRAQMAHAFAQMGDGLRARGELGRAVGYYRQAVDLDPVGPQARPAGARAALCDGLLSLKGGPGEPSLFRRALALDPQLAEARAGLLRSESARARRQWLQAGASLGALFLLVGIGMWTRRRRR